MIKKGTIEFELMIDEPQGNGVGYKSSIDNDLAGLMIACQVMDANLQLLKEFKKQCSGKDKVNVGKNISSLSIALAEANKLSHSLCLYYKEYNEMMEKNLEVEKGLNEGEIQKG